MPALRIKLLIVVTCLALVVLAGTVPAGANCGSPLAVGNAKPGTTPFNNCGANAVGAFWAHQRGVWNVGTGATASGGTGGDDSGSFTASLIDLGGGSYKYAGDWGNSGVDGCVQVIVGDNGASGNACIGQCDVSGLLCQPPSIATCDGLYDSACIGTADLVPTDFLLGGQTNDAGGRATQSTAYFGSVDLNECKQSYAVEDSGAPAGTGTPCADGSTKCNQVAPQQNCAPVPKPSITSFTPGPGGNQTTLNLTFPAQSVPYTDDCVNAASASANCPRNLNAGRVLMMRRGLCNTPPRNDTSTWLATFARNNANSWHPFNAGDLDYNGFPDATPTVPNATTLIPSGAGTGSIVITLSSGRCYVPNTCSGGANNGLACVSNNDCPGGFCSGGALNTTACTSDANCTVGAFTRCAQCLYLGLAAAADATPQAGKTPMLAPYVSMLTPGINLGGRCTGGTCSGNSPCGSAGDVNCAGCGGTCTPLAAPAVPASDRVVDLVASKSGGKATISWGTTAELNIAGFRIEGQRKTGDRFAVSSGLIAPKGGADGQEHHYSVDLSGGDLKGATKIFIVVVHPTGPDETFGPANL